MTTSYSTDAVNEDQIAEYDDDLELCLSQIDKIFDIPRIVNEPQGKQQIVDYYVKGKFLYMLASLKGFYHCGISYDGRHKKEDFKEQARIVERYIHDIDAKNVLELAYGMGGNMAFLARRNPRVMFDGVDLAFWRSKRYAKIPNARFQIGDYHDLSAFEDDSYDIAFVVESLCYSTDKLHVLREVKKKLKRDGLLIVIDGYRKDLGAPLTPSESLMWELIESSWALDKFECVKDVEGYMREEYSIVEANDVTQYALPSVIVLARKLHYYFAHPMFARVVNRLLTFDVAKGLIALYLTPLLHSATNVRRGLGCYYVHVLKNNK
jgi:SAM-dependent methyltransferase